MHTEATEALEDVREEGGEEKGRPLDVEKEETKDKPVERECVAATRDVTKRNRNVG